MSEGEIVTATESKQKEPQNRTVKQAHQFRPRPVCRDFINYGWCNFGRQCKYRHPYSGKNQNFGAFTYTYNQYYDPNHGNHNYRDGHRQRTYYTSSKSFRGAKNSMNVAATAAAPAPISHHKVSLDEADAPTNRSEACELKPIEQAEEPHNTVNDRHKMAQLAPNATLFDRKNLDVAKTEELRLREIAVVKRRCPTFVADADGSIVIDFAPTDPDWPFDVKQLKLRCAFPESYPLQAMTVEVLPDAFMPRMLVRHLNFAVSDWLNEKQAADIEAGKAELAFRPFLKWLDRSMWTLFVDGLKKARLDIQAQNAGISFVRFGSEPHVPDTTVVPKLEQDALESDDSSLSSDVDKDPQTSALKTVNQRGRTSVSFRTCEFNDAVGTLVATKLSAVFVCARCSERFELALKFSKPGDPTTTKHECSKCHVLHSVQSHASIIHMNASEITTMNLLQCQFFDLNLLETEFSVHCMHCNVANKISGMAYGQIHSTWCQQCHAKLTLKVESVKVDTEERQQDLKDPNESAAVKKVRKLLKDVRIQKGEPLPDYGTCKHYKKSYRWFRFPCCGKVYPCDVCHEENEAHEIKFANRMICGFCATEQRYSADKPCVECNSNVTKAITRHWEGGKGCRDKTRMSKNDNQKYSNRNKTISRNAMKQNAGKKTN